MNEETIRRLNQLNHTFYESFADHFSDSRKNPWHGWERVITHAKKPERVLDLGCGNGRFARFLAEKIGSTHYTGIDSSESLLTHAKEEAPSATCFLHEDLVTSDMHEILRPHQPFDLIAVFGLMHHLPSFNRRRRILEALAQHVTVTGLIAVAFWRFGAHERFLNKRISWTEYNRSAALPIDETDLEPNDILLRWDRGGSGYRYCHFVDDAEEARLIDTLPLQVVDRFDADGKTNDLNRYVLMSRRAP